MTNIASSIPVYQIDAFSDHLFGGNPAAVCPLDAPLEDQLMQSIAFENNLSETAFLVKRSEGDYDLRWFTPTAEVDLCGHATLASAWLVFNRLTKGLDLVKFQTKSGELRVKRENNLLQLDFPSRPAKQIDPPEGLVAALGVTPTGFYRASKNMAVFETEAEVLAVKPDFAFIANMNGDGLIVTAPGEGCDYVARYFAPHVGINEDPVTGSAHCTTIPYWAERLGKTKLHAKQVSARGGELFCEIEDGRVFMSGHAVLFLEGQLFLK